MKLFLDSANLVHIREASATGLLEGVNLDPALVAKEGRGMEEIVREVAHSVDGPVFVDAVSQGFEELVEEGRTIARLHRSVVVKVPLTVDGIKAIRRLAHDGVKTNGTHCFSPVQALLASKAGAAYVTPFIGRLDELGENGADTLEKILLVYNNYDLPTQVMVAGVKSPVHVLEAALLGSDCCSMPSAVFRQILNHPLTDAGVKASLEGWRKIPKN
ncbi:MAG TPA: transaldolase family protein [bacterium]|nr:transaldolase family protein [bacterium]